MRIAWTPAAADDLEQISDYLLTGAITNALNMAPTVLAFIPISLGDEFYTTRADS